MSYKGELTFASGISKTRRACDICRGRKIKCIPSTGDTKDCDNCVKKRLNCTFREVFKVRPRMPLSSRSPKKASPGLTLPPLSEITPKSEHVISLPSEPCSPEQPFQAATCSPEQLHALGGLLAHRRYYWGIDEEACRLVVSFFSRFGPNHNFVSLSDMNEFLLSPKKPNTLHLVIHSMATHYLSYSPPNMLPALEHHHRIAREAISNIQELNERLLIAALGMIELVDARFNPPVQKHRQLSSTPRQLSHPEIFSPQPWTATSYPNSPNK